MEKIKFHIDVKQTVWFREFHEVEFESEEALKEKLKKISEQPNFNCDSINDELGSFQEQERLFETEDYLSVDDNDGWSTIEVYMDDEIIAENGK